MTLNFTSSPPKKYLKRSVKDILNELKWRSDRNLDNAEIWYIHRGAPNDTMIISGREIVRLDKSFMHTHHAEIPYHRIFKIVYNGEIIFLR
jgi:uncharacterized protein (UPF0248 family)